MSARPEILGAIVLVGVVSYLCRAGGFFLISETLAAGVRVYVASIPVKLMLGDKILGKDYSLRIIVHRGAGAYECGEETALLESLEGKQGMPRVKPPFPASVGLYNKPTVINNVETLANVPFILDRGADWYKTLGTDKSPGPKVFCLSGHVNRPGNYEAPLGSITFRDLIYGEQFGQGMRNGKKVKAILPAGASAPMLTEAALDVKLDYVLIKFLSW